MLFWIKQSKTPDYCISYNRFNLHSKKWHGHEKSKQTYCMEGKNFLYMAESIAIYLNTNIKFNIFATSKRFM